MRSTVEPRAERMRIGVAVGLAADGADDGAPVEPGKHQVEDDECRLMVLDRGESGGPVGGRHDAIALALQVGAHEPDDLGVVVHDQDGSIGLGHPRDATSGPVTPV